MKNINDIIISIASLVLAGIFAGVFYSMKPTPEAPPAPPSVNAAAATAPEGKVVLSNSLPNAKPASTQNPDDASGQFPPGFGPGGMGMGNMDDRFGGPGGMPFGPGGMPR